MTDAIPNPAELLHDLLVNLATRAAERAWRLASARWYRRSTVETHIGHAIDETVGSIELGLDRELLTRFLSSPELTGVVDRLLAFRILESEFATVNLPANRGSDSRSRPLTQKEKEREDAVQEDLATYRARWGTSSDSVPRVDTMSKALQRECRRVTELWFGSDHRVKSIIQTLYPALLAATDAAYTVILAQDYGALTIRPDIRRWLLSVEPRLQMLDGLSSIQAFLDFENKLRLEVAAHHKWLRAPHLGREVRIDMLNGYVLPRFRPYERATSIVDGDAGDVDKVVSAIDLIERIDRTVVLGDPGAGKSSFGAALCFRVATEYETRPVARGLLTPLFITLRDIAGELSEAALTEILETVVRTVYQIVPPPGAITYLLSQGRLLVVFDGLDELLQVNERQRLRDAIESFCRLYPMTHVLVTSRNVGYEYAQLDALEFDTFTLEEFDESEVEQYSVRWFSMQEELSVTRREQQARAFLRESLEHAHDLRKNPLLLALLCGVYRSEGTLPSSRPAVYQRCTALLLRQWDAMRQIKVDDPLGEHLERTLRHVADWIYHDDELTSGVPEKLLVRRCMSYIAELRANDMEEATEIAQSFVDFCGDRSWVLVKIGFARTGEPLFAFAHRTFLEYFAAQHLEKRSRTPSDLSTALKRLVSGSASVVPQLALQLANESRDDAGDEILNELMNDAEDDRSDNDAQRERLLVFVVESLRYIVPRPTTTRRVARTAAYGIIEPLLEDTTRYDGSIGSSPWETVAAGLGAIAESNVPAAASGYKEGLERALDVSDRHHAQEILRQGVARQPPYLVSVWQRAYPDLF
jgi:NACHT domain